MPQCAILKDGEKKIQEGVEYTFRRKNSPMGQNIYFETDEAAETGLHKAE
jgi:hypothetical protein